MPCLRQSWAMAKPTPLAPPEMSAVAPWRKKVDIVVASGDITLAGCLGVSRCVRL